jgi:hypothetical protein
MELFPGGLSQVHQGDGAICSISLQERPHQAAQFTILLNHDGGGAVRVGEHLRQTIKLVGSQQKRLSYDTRLLSTLTLSSMRRQQAKQPLGCFHRLANIAQILVFAWLWLVRHGLFSPSSCLSDMLMENSASHSSGRNRPSVPMRSGGIRESPEFQIWIRITRIGQICPDVQPTDPR